MSAKFMFALCGLTLFAGLGCASRTVYRPTMPIAALVSSANEEQIAYLKNGAEVRGILVERDPNKGDVLKLSDGSLRAIPRDEIIYMGRPGSGGLHIEAPEPTTVSIDRQPFGRTPIDVANIAPGPHTVRVVYDAGDSTEQEVVVAIARVTSVSMPLPALRAVAARREGRHWVFGGGLQLGSTLGEDLLTGLGVQGGIDLGLSPGLDFRVLGHLGFGDVDASEAGVWYEVGVSGAFRFHLSALYSMELGARIGVMPYSQYEYVGYPSSWSRENHATFAFGLQGSLLSLNLGEDRSSDLTLWHALQAGTSTNFSFRTGVSFSDAW